MIKKFYVNSDAVKLIKNRQFILSDSNKGLLDEFFEDSNEIVLSQIVQRFNHVVDEDKRYILSDKNYVPKKKFKVSVPVVKFPNSYHEPEILYYLEDKYQDKITDLGLDTYGITNPHLIPSHHNFEKDLHLDYSSPNSRSLFSDATFGYALEVDVDLREKEKTKKYI